MDMSGFRNGATYEQIQEWVRKKYGFHMCDAADTVETQNLDDYEAEERFTLEYVDPRIAIEINRKPDHGPKDQVMLEREARVLEMLIAEGLFGEER